jgi:hypothetical protein
LGAVAPVYGQQVLAGFGTGSFVIESSASTGLYTQSAGGLFFGPTVNLGDTVGGRVASFAVDPPAESLSLMMQRTGANPGLAFTVELVDASYSLIARYTGQTTAVSEAPTLVPLSISEISIPGQRGVAGVQFTWDGSGGVGMAILSLVSSASPGPSPTPTPVPSPTPAASPSPTPSASPTPVPSPSPSPSASPAPEPTPTPNPTPTPQPTPTPSPTPSVSPTPVPSPSPSPSASPTPSPSPTPTPSPIPSPEPSPSASPTPQPSPEPSPEPTPDSTPPPVVDRAAPSVFITSSTSARKDSYTLRVTVYDDIKPTRLGYRVRPPGKKNFGGWTYVSLLGDTSTQVWSRRLILKKKGKWRIEVQAFDASSKASALRSIRVKRK